ncbi:MAG TPA: TIGR04211 family SH3 domain-containing protein [Gammaproteobacteria bacterium]|nr:TIGR04211 family SH3 domain-containing protein [Gammaproteobacteria bacterium]
MLLLLGASLPAQAATRYVSDELKIPMRSGASNQHRIIKFLISGTPVTVLETSEDGKFTHVELNSGKSGWVLSSDLQDIPSGRARLASANKKLEKYREEIASLKSTVKELNAEVRQLKKENKTLQNERTNLSNAMEDLKITAANPLSLAKKNKQLKKELSKVRKHESALEDENQRLRSSQAQEWFLIGGGVAIGSLILGLIITRINWRRKRNSWGDSF